MGKLFFRAEGNASIGLGHLIRSSALADMIRDYFTICFVINPDAPETIKEDFNKYSVVFVETDSAFVNMLSSEDGVVLDGYHYSSSLQKTIKSRGALLVSIDDMHNKHFYADLIINQALGISSQNYSAESSAKFLFGPNYVIVRQPFLKRLVPPVQKEKVESVIMCFGGSDFKGLTIPYLDQLEKLRSELTVHVVVGAAYLPIDNLKIFAKNSKHQVHIHHNINSKVLASLISSADIAILPASSILLEVLSMGITAISGYYTENQQDIYQGYLDEGLIIGAGDFNNIQEAGDLIRNAIEANVRVNRIKSYFDGQSPKRLKKEFIKLFFPVQGILRKATFKDCELLFNWANDKETRNNSIHTNAITWEEHVKWFTDKLKDRDCHIFIAGFNSQKVGQIRFDVKDDYIDLTYAVAPMHRGIGFGEMIVKYGISELKKINLSQKKIRALVKENNMASLIVFQKNDFTVCPAVQIENSSFSQFQLTVY